MGAVEIKPKYDRNKELWVTKNDVMGNVAKWCIIQSPYDYPEQLPTILNALSGIITSHFKSGVVGMVKYDLNKLMDDLKNWLEQIPEFTELNNRKNGKDGHSYITRFDGERDPDDDFIDLHALYRNVAHNIYTDQL